MFIQLHSETRNGATTLGQMNDDLILDRSTASDTTELDRKVGLIQWGDYAGASPDPLSSRLVWGTSQLHGANSKLGGNTWYSHSFAIRTPR
jgi:hypothetical protein